MKLESYEKQFLDSLVPIKGISNIRVARGSGYSYVLNDELIKCFTDRGSGIGVELSGNLEDDVELLSRYSYIPQVSSGNKEEVIKIVSLNLLNQCNMGCSYCSVGGSGSYGRGTVEKMSVGTGLKVVDFLTSFNHNSFHIIFFGGEPLLNFRVIKAIVERCAATDKHWLFTLVTNGSLITDEIAKFLRKYKFRTVVTLDGPPQVQNRSRPLKDPRKSSYEYTSKGISILKNNRCRYDIKFVYQHNNDFSYEDIMDFIEPMVEGEGNHVVPSLEHSENEHLFYQHYLKDDLQTLAQNKTLSYYEQRRNDEAITKCAQIICGNFAQDLHKQCPAGSSALQVSPDGRFYACHIAEAEGKWGMGSVDEGLTAEYEQTKKEFTDWPKCKDCWNNSFCHKVCPVHKLREKERLGSFEPPDEFCDYSMSATKEAFEYLVSNFDNVYRQGLGFLKLYNVTSREEKMVRQLLSLHKSLCSQLRLIKPLFIFPTNLPPIDLMRSRMEYFKA